MTSPKYFSDRGFLNNISISLPLNYTVSHHYSSLLNFAICKQILSA
jgi:hypothetical protein